MGRRAGPRCVHVDAQGALRPCSSTARQQMRRLPRRREVALERRHLDSRHRQLPAIATPATSPPRDKVVSTCVACHGFPSRGSPAFRRSRRRRRFRGRLNERSRVAAEPRRFSPRCFARARGCGGGASNGSLQVPTPNALTTADVKQIIAQAVCRGAGAATPKRRSASSIASATCSAIFKMNGAAPTFTINGGNGAVGGLEGRHRSCRRNTAVVPKALTAAYFSSAGNAFSTRTAGQIIQEHFNPGEFEPAGGPALRRAVQPAHLLGCQPEADAGTMVGPHRSPLGFAADPGGLPLYKNGIVVGAVGGARRRTLFDRPQRDRLRLSGHRRTHRRCRQPTASPPPTAIRADHITVDGRTLRYTDSEALLSNPALAPTFVRDRFL